MGSWNFGGIDFVIEDVDMLPLSFGNVDNIQTHDVCCSCCHRSYKSFRPGQDSTWVCPNCELFNK